MDVKLRQERPTDYRETERLTREAFWDQHTPGCDEHYLVHIMRSCPAFVQELDIVAELGGKIIGHVACVKASVKGDDGQEREALTLGPLSVLPEYQGRGIGSRLLAMVKKTASQMGFRAIFLCGDPGYYSRQGFVAAEAFGIRMANNKYLAALQVCELYENALQGAGGLYIEDKIYNVDQSLAAGFDKMFPARETVVGNQSQKRFEQLCAMQKEYAAE